MTNKQKALWLQKNYGNYSLAWYLADESRLNAIFSNEYQKYINGLKEQVNNQEQARLQTTLERLKQAYHDYYHSDYEIDNAINRAETNERAQNIRHLWVSQSIA